MPWSRHDGARLMVNKHQTEFLIEKRGRVERKRERLLFLGGGLGSPHTELLEPTT